MKVNPGGEGSFIGILKEVKEIGRIYLRSETVIETTSKIP
jgi:hypothetical protein